MGSCHLRISIGVHARQERDSSRNAWVRWSRKGLYDSWIERIYFCEIIFHLGPTEIQQCCNKSEWRCFRLVWPSRDCLDKCFWEWPSIVSICALHLFYEYMLMSQRNRSKDVVFNPELLIPPRPTISGVQWLTGTQYVTPADLDLLSKSQLMKYYQF